ncbi:MAG: hypothetical protein LKJ69_01985 [Lactobacillus sp.]|jgi:hypothetical protein|nr:hypothetical protein [Lactobacillus sp.]MCI2032151.1 hypothetical protein [Lactobacillus sp.]
MITKLRQAVWVLDLVEIVMALIGFYNFAANTTNHDPLFVTSLSSLSGLLFWALFSMLCVVGFTLSLYLMIGKKQSRSTGLLISAIAFGSPLLFSFFLIIPATLSLLGAIFIGIDDAEEA